MHGKRKSLYLSVEMFSTTVLIGDTETSKQRKQTNKQTSKGNKQTNKQTNEPANKTETEKNLKIKFWRVDCFFLAV